MGYVGTAPLSGDYRKLDDISGSFNGSTTDFTLQVGSANVTPPKETTMLISVGGILQEPVSAYTVSGSTISFTSAPASGADFFGILLGDTMAIGTPSDATITAAKVENTFISGQTEITSGLDAADELLYSDGGTIKKVGLDTLADKLAGTNITASAGVLSGTADTNTTYTGGTNLTLAGTTFNVDDAFLVNNASDATSGTITMAHLIIGDGGNIGSASDTDAIAISAGGDVTFTQTIYIKDDEKIVFGDGSDASIEYDENGTDQLRIVGNTIFENQIALTVDVKLFSTPADESVSGLTATFTAGEALERGEVVYFKASDTKMWKAVATAAATSRCVAMAAEDISADSNGLFLLQGFCADNGTFPTYTVGGAIYTPEAETGGQNVPEQTAPDTDGDFVQVIGWAFTTNSVYFNPSNDIIEHA